MHMRVIFRFLCTVLLLLTCRALSAQNEAHRIRNIVLVHGAWADGSGWKGVYDVLVKDGYNVQEPETSFKEDVAATKRVLAQEDGPSILVAHSYGGVIITEVGTDPSVVVDRLSAWCISRPTCQMPGRKSQTTESAFRALSPNRAP